MSGERSRTRVNYLAKVGVVCSVVRGGVNVDSLCWQDWPENVSGPAVSSTALESVRREFELEVSGVCQTVVSLVEARQDTIDKLRVSAAYLDSVWLRCRVSRTLGTSVSVVGGGLTIAGGVLTTLTAGAAAPVLIAGVATSTLGAATNIGTSVVEKIINSRQIREMNEAFDRDREVTMKFESQLQDLRRTYKDSPYLSTLYYSIKESIGGRHLLIPVLQTILLYDDNPFHSRPETDTERHNLPQNPSLLTSSNSADNLSFNPLDAEMVLDGGKVIGQNSLRVAGQVIIGINAAFLVWDAIDLGFNITDLVKKKGSEAAKVLTVKAELLESALKETLSNYKVK